MDNYDDIQEELLKILAFNSEDHYKTHAEYWKKRIKYDIAQNNDKVLDWYFEEYDQKYLYIEMSVNGTTKTLEYVKENDTWIPEVPLVWKEYAEKLMNDPRLRLLFIVE
jgi:hypothetical protein